MKKIQPSIKNQQLNPTRFKWHKFKTFYKNSEYLRKVDGVDVSAQPQRNVDQTNEQSQETQHSVLPIQSLLRISGVVSVRVRKPGSYEDESAQRRKPGQFDANEQQEAEEHRNLFQRVLVSPLHAVEHFVLVTVHGWIGNAVLLPRLAHLDCQEGDHYDGVHNSQQHPVVVCSQCVKQRPHNILFKCKEKFIKNWMVFLIVPAANIVVQ